MATYPNTNEVLSGIMYGPNDTDFVGTLPGYQDVITLLNGLQLYFNIHAQSIPIFTGIIIKNLFSYSSWNFNISGIGAEDTDFHLTIKNNSSDNDSESVLQLNTSGVTYLSGVYLGQPSGQLTYSSGAGGTLNVSVEPNITKDIPSSTYFWDIKNTTTNRQIRSYGHIKIDTPITRSF